ncbi:hypothetical protein FRB90_003264 [Tulasnella sp. 427]|nr:hypothetical protein FRB90_003264 [Tulasnella sp. 427]
MRLSKRVNSWRSSLPEAYSSTLHSTKPPQSTPRGPSYGSSPSGFSVEERYVAYTLLEFASLGRIGGAVKNGPLKKTAGLKRSSPAFEDYFFQRPKGAYSGMYIAWNEAEIRCAKESLLWWWKLVGPDRHDRSNEIILPRRSTDEGKADWIFVYHDWCTRLMIAGGKCEGGASEWRELRELAWLITSALSKYTED